jgi:hypothetical protein
MHFSRIFVIYLTTDTQRHRHNTVGSLPKKYHLNCFCIRSARTVPVAWHIVTVLTGHHAIACTTDR